MKKFKKHILIVCLLLLFGIAFLTLSVHAASTFSWLKGTDSSQSQSVKGHSKAARNTGKEAGNVFLSPIAGSFLPGSTSGNSAAGRSGSAGAKNAAVDEGPLEPSLTETISGGATDFSGSGSGCDSIDGSASGTSSEAPKPSGSGSGSSGKSSGSSGTSSSSSGSSSGSSGINSGTTDSGNSSGSTSSSGSSSSGSSGNRHHHHDHGSSTVGISKVTIDKSELALKKGETAALTATVFPSNTTQDKTVVWSSSNESIATVDSAGKVTAVEGGKVDVTAKSSNGKTAVCSVTVSVPATAITLSLSDAPIERGKTLSLTAALEPADSTDKVLWATSDSNIATVDDSGNVTGVAPGTVTITASVGDGTISASCKITTVVSISELDLSDTDLTLKKGEEHTLTATIEPEDTTEDKAVTWSSSNESVATVDSTGKVTAVEGGTAILTAQTGKHSAQCTVTVVVPITGIKFDPDTIAVAKGTTEALTPIFTPADATDRAVVWGSSDKSIATVDQNGKVTGVSVGTAAVTAITHDGDYVARCTVNVVIPVTGISVSPATLELIKGTAGTTTATIFPPNATDKTVFWSSSDSRIASVDQDGKISANNVGAATITAKAEDGGYSAACAVTVKPNTYTVTAIAGNGGSVLGGGVYQVGSDVTLTATPDPHYHLISWTDSHGAVIGSDKTCTISSLSADTTVYANFAIDTFTVTVKAGKGGTVTGGGTYPYGTVITLKAIPDENYEFLNWSDGTLDNPRSCTVTEDAAITAEFKRIPITWTETLLTPDNQTTALAWRTTYDSNTSQFTFINTTGESQEWTSLLKYQFDRLLTLPKGTKIQYTYHVEGNDGWAGGHCYVSLDDSEIISHFGLDGSGDGGYTNSTVDGVYFATSDLNVSTVTVKNLVSARGDNWTTGTLSLTVQLPDGTAFLLDGKNTSDQ